MFEGNSSVDMQISQNSKSNNTVMDKQTKEFGNEIINIKTTSPQYTICQKMALTEDKTIVQYLFDEGKCGKICRTGDVYYFLGF